jgi:xanthine dehydrogenase YagS FAD-binding subunit
MLYEMPAIQHVSARTIEEAVSSLVQNSGRAQIVAGGTDLLGLMKDAVKGPHLDIPRVLVNLKAIPELQQIREEADGITIGAAVPLSRLETSTLVGKFPVLVQAAGQVGTTQIRNMGTVGGNICQRPRCLYFRHPDFICFKKGGKGCFAAGGEHRYYHAILKYGKCLMAHPSDLAPALLCLRAEAVLAGPDGERTVPLKDFFRDGNHLPETILNPAEMITRFRVPYSPARQIFLKNRIRRAFDFALVSVAAAVRFSEEKCEDVSIVLGGVAAYPYIASSAERVLRGKPLEKDLIEAAAEAALRDARPLPHNDYKVDLAKALVERALRALETEALPSGR